MVNMLPGDVKMTLDMVVVYTANAAGKITSLKAYWDFDAVQRQLQ
jgi:steroid delta-isomerase